MRKLTFILLALPVSIWAQAPIINSISPRHVEVGEIVNISGSGFHTTAAMNTIYFGGVIVPDADIIPGTLSANLIEVRVPEGVTQGSVTVINEDTGLMGSSSEHFYSSFSGRDITNFDPEVLVSTTQPDAYDICLCDLDGDELLDVIISHNIDDDGLDITIFENQTTTGGTASLVLNQSIDNVNPGEGFSLISTTCTDLDLDGKPDLIFTTNFGTNNNHIFIYENQSSGDGNFNLNPLAPGLDLDLPRVGSNIRTPRRIKSADIDRDGKPDLVVGNEVDNMLHIFRNMSPGDGNFMFDAPVGISAGMAVTTGSLDLADLNNDGKVDIVTLPFDKFNASIYVLKNNSIPGTFMFELEAGISVPGRRVNIKVGDFDDDGLNDLAVTTRPNTVVSVFRNTTIGADITFGSAYNIGFPATATGLWGLDLGDINGDGRLDIITSSVTKNVFVAENTSMGTGSIAFGMPAVLSSSLTTRNVCVGDLNGDAKPDIAYTHNITLGNIGNLGVRINRNCIVPSITPAASSGINFCIGTDFRLFATNTAGATYNWSIVPSGAGSIRATTDNFADFNISAATATIRVEIIHTGTICTPTPSHEETFSLNSTVTPDPSIRISKSGTLCVSDDVTLSSSTSNPTYTYLWTLPDGSTQTTATINLASVDPSDAGVYRLRIQNSGDCASSEVTHTVTVSDPPAQEIFNNGPDNFCASGSTDLQIADYSAGGFTYQWKRNGENIPTGGTNALYRATQSGQYTVAVTEPATSCTEVTPGYTVNAVAQPVPAFTGPPESCVSSETTYTSSSTGANGFSLEYAWSVTGPRSFSQKATTRDISLSFPEPGSYAISLTTSYPSVEVASCTGPTEVMDVTVSPAPVITFSHNMIEKCPTDSVEISLTTPDASTISSYQWIINGNTTTGSTAFAKTQLNQDSTGLISIITTKIGCTIRNTLIVKNFDTNVSIVDSKSRAKRDTTVNAINYQYITLTEENSLELKATDISNATWEPSDIIDNPMGTSVAVFPNQPFTVVTLKATDNTTKCQISKTIGVLLDNIRPRKTFSPNGDGLGFDCWEILNITDKCEVYVFDSRGRNILVTNTFDGNCVWNGNFSGTPVPEGIYYYVMKCADMGINKSGSILLAR